MRLIDADDLQKELKERIFTEEAPSVVLTPTGQEIFNSGIESAIFAVLEAETIDAVPVVHARWIHDINNKYGCSACMTRDTMSHRCMKRYCPNCGAKMDA